MKYEGGIPEKYAFFYINKVCKIGQNHRFLTITASFFSFYQNKI